MPPETSGAERAQRIVEEATARLAADLAAGKSDTLREYLSAMGRFHRYSWTNTLLIQSQRPTATRVAGYHTWRDLGRSVRRGEKGIVIYAPVIRRATKEVQAPLPAEKTEPREPVGFRAAYVFDVAQTEGKALPEFSRTGGDPGEHLARLKEAVAKRGITLEYHDSLVEMFGAEGLSKGGRIDIARGLEPAEEFSVLTHEFAHELLHRGVDRAALSKTVRETQAEAVAFVVSHGIGLDTNTAARDYIALYDGNAETLTESLAAVQRASSEILRDLIPAERSNTERSAEPLVERSPETREATSQMLTPPNLPRPTATSVDQADQISPER
jgi:antirestriction protein ArdC